VLQTCRASVVGPYSAIASRLHPETSRKKRRSSYSPGSTTPSSPKHERDAKGMHTDREAGDFKGETA